MNQIFYYLILASTTILCSGAVSKNDYSHSEEICQEIVEKLVKAWGLDIPSSKMPKVKITPNNPKSKLPIMADGQLIKMQMSIYTICKNISKGNDKIHEAALATLLGHELAHILSDDNIPFKAKSVCKENCSKIERKADIIGLFNAYIAKYKVKNLYPLVLDAIYHHYHLDKENGTEKYPTLAQRKATAQEVNDKIQEMIIQFEMASHLTAIGDYKTAISLYECLLKDYPSPEMHNNMGVALVLAARQANPSKMPYALPLMLDLESKLYAKDNGFGFGGGKYNELLEKALVHFDAAILKKKKQSYEEAKENRACALLLLDKSEKEVLNKISSSRPSYHILHGIFHAHHYMQFTVAKNQWAKVNNIRYLGIIKHNKDIINGEKNSTPTTIQYNHNLKSKLRLQSIPVCKDIDFDSLKFLEKGEDKYFRIILNAQKKLDISLERQQGIDDDDIKTLRKTYPTSYELLTNQGGYLIVPNQGLFFIFQGENVTYKGQF